MPQRGTIRKPIERTVTLPSGYVRQQELASQLGRSPSEVRRWLERRDCARKTEDAQRVLWRVDETLVDALEEWGYDVTAPADLDES